MQKLILVFLYGPPAAGKLTIAKILRKKSGFKLLENNRTNRVVQEIFPFGSPPFIRLVEELRLNMFKEAALESVDLITTFVYSHHQDDGFVRAVLDAVTYHGRVLFVQLTCPESVLLKRIQNPDRKGHNKLVDQKTLKEMLADDDLLKPIPFVESLILDTSKLSAEESAERIMREIKLYFK